MQEAAILELSQVARVVPTIPESLAVACERADQARGERWAARAQATGRSRLDRTVVLADDGQIPERGRPARAVGVFGHLARPQERDRPGRDGAVDLIEIRRDAAQSLALLLGM